MYSHVFTMGSILCAPHRKVCKVIICHPSCLCWSVQLRLAYKEDKSTVIMTLNLQILFLLRLNCVSVTAGSGDLLGNCVFLCVSCSIRTVCVSWFAVWVTMFHLHVCFYCFASLCCLIYLSSPHQYHMDTLHQYVCLWLQTCIVLTFIPSFLCLSSDELRTYIQA